MERYQPIMARPTSQSTPDRDLRPRSSAWVWRACCGCLALALLVPALAQRVWASGSGKPGIVLLVSREAPRDPAVRKRIASAASKPEQRVILRLLKADEEAAAGEVGLRWKDQTLPNDALLAMRVRRAQAVELHGGSFMDWFDTVTPRGEQTRLSLAIRDASRRGATVIGFGQAAGFLSVATTIRMQELLEHIPSEKRNPRRTDTQLAVSGLGFGPPVLVDADDWPEGSPWRLLYMLWETKIDRGCFIEGELALVYDSDTGVLGAVGPGRWIFVELAGARRKRTALREGRLSLLCAEDHWSLGESRILPVAEARRRPAAQTTHELRHEGERDLLGAGPLTSLASALWVQPAARGLRYEKAGRELVLRLDERTDCYSRGAAISVVDLDFDLLWE